MRQTSYRTPEREEVALVTGSRRGIGFGIALALASNGFRTILNAVSPARNAKAAIEEIRDAGGKATYIRADISKNTQRLQLISKIKEAFGRLDILVNNAGVSPESREDLLVATEESFDRLIRINLKGPYFLSQLVANWMVEQKLTNSDRRQMIINVSSISAYTASIMRGEYCISKAGISMMTKLFAARLAEYGIGVYEIRPGIIATDMTATVKDHYDKLINEGLIPIRSWGNPENVGKAVLAVALGHFPYSTAEVINVDGGFHLRTL